MVNYICINKTNGQNFMVREKFISLIEKREVHIIIGMGILVLICLALKHTLNGVWPKVLLW